MTLNYSPGRRGGISRRTIDDGPTLADCDGARLTIRPLIRRAFSPRYPLRHDGQQEAPVSRSMRSFFIPGRSIDCFDPRGTVRSSGVVSLPGRDLISPAFRRLQMRRTIKRNAAPFSFPLCECVGLVVMATESNFFSILSPSVSCVRASRTFYYFRAITSLDKRATVRAPGEKSEGKDCSIF